MTYLLLSILLNASLFVIFRFLDKKSVHLPTVILINYLVCIELGILFSPITAFKAYEQSFKWIHVALGSLFFGIFYLMGKSSAANGVGITSAAGKMSLMVSGFLLAFYFNIKINWIYILSMILALYALYLLSNLHKVNIADTKLWMPILIFLGSGLIETCLAISKQKQQSLGLEQGPSIVFIFSGALLTSIAPVINEWIKRRLKVKNIWYGLFLGIINYYSIHFLLLALGNRKNLSVNEFIIVHNTSVVILSFLLGILIFKEKAGWKQIIGIFLSILAISLTLFEHI